MPGALPGPAITTHDPDESCPLRAAPTCLPMLPPRSLAPMAPATQAQSGTRTREGSHGWYQDHLAASSCEQTHKAKIMSTHSHTHVHMSYHDMGGGQRRDPCVPETPGRR